MKRDMSLDWDESQEEKTVEETVEWFPQADDEDRRQAREEVDGWMVLGSKKMTIEDETQFCSKDTLEEMLKSKEVRENSSILLTRDEWYIVSFSFCDTVIVLPQYSAQFRNSVKIMKLRYFH